MPGSVCTARVAACFHARDEAWILPRKLHALTQFCDGIVVVLDRWPEGRAICREWSSSRCPIEIVEHRNTMGLPPEGSDGPICEEGRMRQVALDACLNRFDPTWVILGDADEIPTPDIVEVFNLSDIVEVFNLSDLGFDGYRLRWVNLFGSERLWLTDCIWSPHHPRSNQKGAILRVRPERQYRYDLEAVRHCPIEPLGLRMWSAGPMLVHYKYLHDERRRRELARTKYLEMLVGARLGLADRRWFWPGQPEVLL